MKILVVDDEKLLVKGITFNLANEGYEVTAAYDGEAAVELAKKGDIDLIVMDVMMPVRDGHEATRAIRAMDRPDAKTIPIFAMTANAFTEDHRKALEAGMNEHLPKPIDLDALYRLLVKYLTERS